MTAAKKKVKKRSAPASPRKKISSVKNGVSIASKKVKLSQSKKPSDSTKEKSPSQWIDQRIAELKDWRGETLSQIRSLILQVSSDIVEEWKWRGVPVWSCHGIICTGESYKSVVKMTFMKGAELSDPQKIFNSSLEGNARRAIDFQQGDKINTMALKKLIQDAIALNQASKTKSKK